MNLKNGIVVTVSIHYTYLKLYQICKNFELFSNQFFATIKSVGGGGGIMQFLHYIWNILCELKFSNYSFKPSFLNCCQLRDHTGGFVVLLLAVSLSGWRTVTIKGSFMSCNMSCNGYGSIYLLAFVHSVSFSSSPPISPPVAPTPVPDMMDWMEN